MDQKEMIANGFGIFACHIGAQDEGNQRPVKQARWQVPDRDLLLRGLIKRS